MMPKREDVAHIVYDAWKLKDIGEQEILKLLGIYSLYDKSPDEILGVFSSMKTQPLGGYDNLEPRTRKAGFFPTEDTLSPRGVVDALETLMEYGRLLWEKYHKKIHELLCNGDGSCKYQFETVEDLRDIIILITGAIGIGYGMTACLAVLVYQKGYPAFCEKFAKDD